MSAGSLYLVRILSPEFLAGLESVVRFERTDDVAARLLVHAAIEARTFVPSLGRGPRAESDRRLIATVLRVAVLALDASAHLALEKGDTALVARVNERLAEPVAWWQCSVLQGGPSR